jgi:hypothetical protein|tara:strand:- start:603 stop:1403 length:801 start_codon:yes stop_codon:yes gene_type:complete
MTETQVPPGIATIYGPPGTLKTSIAMTWPGKVDIYDFDLGAQRGWRVKEFTESGHVKISRMLLPAKSITTRHQQLEGFMRAWQDFLTKFMASCEDEEVSAISVDTSTMLWSFIQDSYLEELQQVKFRKQLTQFEFREPNGRMRALFNAVRAHDKWLILIHHEADEYLPVTMNGRPVLDGDGNQKTTVTGAKVPDGFKHTRGMSDWIFKTEVLMVPTKDEETGEVGDRLTGRATIEKSAMGIDLIGLQVNWFEYGKLEQRLKLLGRV